MQKIMFNDKYGLTKAVLKGRKTMTRRIVNEKMLACANDYVQKVHGTGHDFLDYLLEHSLFKVGEVVAVAQSYQDAGYYPMGTKDEPGWRNKMFVRADLMPHKIRITNVRAERLQDISDEDCLKEGILNCKDDPDFSHLQKDFFYHEGSYDGYLTPRKAFAALIDKISGKGTWESNPWVFVYEFELVK